MNAGKPVVGGLRAFALAVGPMHAADEPRRRRVPLVLDVEPIARQYRFGTVVVMN